MMIDFWYYVLTDGFVHYPLNNRMIASDKIEAKFRQAKERESEYTNIDEVKSDEWKKLKRTIRGFVIFISIASFNMQLFKRLEAATAHIGERCAQCKKSQLGKLLPND